MLASKNNPSSPSSSAQPTAPASPPKVELSMAATQQDYPYYIGSTSHATVEREVLGFKSFAKLRSRALATLLGGQFVAVDENARGAVVREAIGVQTDEMPVREVGVGVSDDALYRERTEELNLGLCGPRDLPLMTVSQLLEAERRLSDLLNRLEAEVSRAEEQERQLRQGREEQENNAMDQRFGRFIPTSTWNQRMADTIERRLRARNGDAPGVTPGVFWHRWKLGSIGSPQRKRMETHSPTREKCDVYMKYDFKSPQAGGGGVWLAQQRAKQAAEAAMAKAGTVRKSSSSPQRPQLGKQQPAVRR